jgi:hypothetical protein
MKKILLFISFLTAFGSVKAQNLVTENFDVFPAAWTKLNLSSPAGTNAWANGAAANIANIAGGAGAYNGTAATSYAYVNFNSTTGTGVISNWLITTPISLMNGDVISFYAVKGLSGGATVYPDALQMRISTLGAASALPTGTTGVGDFTTLAVDINPAPLTTTGFATTWTLYSYTVTGLPTATSCRVAFRYTVPTSAGPSGNNSDQIGVDQYSVDRTLSTDNFFKNNFSVYPNPVKDVLNISNLNAAENTKISISDINGRIVKEINSSLNSVSISELNAGVYFLKINTLDGVGTTKIIKN